MSPKEVRQRARRSQAYCAVHAGVCEPTLRLYEAEPSAVSTRTRAKLDAFYARLAAEVTP